MWWCLVLVVSLRWAHGQQDEGNPCVPRKFGQDSFVCVCNATYCDTLPRPVAPAEGKFALYTSDLKSQRFNKTIKDFSKSRGVRAQTVDFTLGNNTYQSMLGFGGAITDAATHNILSLKEDLQDVLLRAYYSNSGIEYNLGRINIGGCDFSLRAYTCDDNDGDVKLEKFELQPEDLQYKIPVIKKASGMADKGLKIFGSPWTSPPWMKTNKDYTGYGQLLPEMYQPWADYIIKFLDGYKEKGVPLWGITAENEPTAGYQKNYPFNCLGFTAEQQRKWIVENLGPSLEKNGYKDISLMIMDDQRSMLPSWAETVLNDADAKSYVDGVAVHWYDRWASIDKQDTVHSEYPDQYILSTEACEGFGGPHQPSPVRLGMWTRLEDYAYDIIRDANHWTAGWVDWNIALNMEGGPNWANMSADAAVIVNPDKDEFYKNPMFYAMGHFSKFVKEGAVRVELTTDNSQGLETVAFKNEDGSRVIVILNKSNSEFDVSVKVEDQGTMAVTIGAHSITTAIF